jgi:hypothetical protein
MILILAIAGAAGFLGSVFLLWSGFDNMALRYALAVAISYLVFLALIRVWLALYRRRWSVEMDLPTGGGGRSEAAPALGGGGRFGGGGAGRSFDSPTESVSRPVIEVLPTSSPAGHGGAADVASALDLDDAWPLALALLLLLGGVIGLAFVIYASPILFAEAALDAAVVSTVYRRVRLRPNQHWLTGVLRRTWIPAIALTFFMGLAGLILQSAAAPDARSLGGVFEKLSEE